MKMNEAMKNELETKELEAVSGGIDTIRQRQQMVRALIRTNRKLNEVPKGSAQTEEENNG